MGESSSSVGAYGHSADQPHIHLGPCGQYAQAYIDRAPSGSESRFVSPREPEVTDRPTPQGAVRSAPRRCPSSLASTTSGGLFARADRTSKALEHPTRRSESHAPIGSHKSARYVILRPHYGDGDLRRDDLGRRPSRRSSDGSSHCLGIETDQGASAAGYPDRPSAASPDM